MSLSIAAIIVALVAWLVPPWWSPWWGRKKGQVVTRGRGTLGASASFLLILLTIWLIPTPWSPIFGEDAGGIAEFEATEDGVRITVKPTADGEFICQVVYRFPDGREQVISTSVPPGGTATLTVTEELPDGTVVTYTGICQHEADVYTDTGEFEIGSA